MTELERFELCRQLPRLSCGSLVRVAPDLAQAYLADIEWVFTLLPEMRRRYDATQLDYVTLPPHVKAVADVLLPWMLHLRLRYGAECAAMMVQCFPKMSAQSRVSGLQQSN